MGELFSVFVLVIFIIIAALNSLGGFEPALF